MATHFISFHRFHQKRPCSAAFGAIYIRYRQLEKEKPGLGFEYASLAFAQARPVSAKPRPACAGNSILPSENGRARATGHHAPAEASHGEQKYSKTAKQNNRRPRPGQGAGRVAPAAPSRDTGSRKSKTRRKTQVFPILLGHNSITDYICGINTNQYAY